MKDKVKNEGSVKRPVKRAAAVARPAAATNTRKQRGVAKDSVPGETAALMTEARAKVAPARLAAFEILELVDDGKGHSDELLHSARLEKLSEEDRRLAMALVMGVLRWQIALDARLRGFLERPEQRPPEAVSIALRMGAFQLLHMDRIPAHAALSESVELCRAGGEPRAAGMVNAVLRRLSEAKQPGAKLHETPAAFAVRLGHPDWLVKRWAAVYGRDVALKICEADQKEPVDGGIFAEYGAGLPQMDDGSRLVAELAAVAMPAAHRVWDCCAAPGGKTLMLARRLTSAEIVASDVSARRMAMTEARLKRHSYAERVVCAAADAADAKGVHGKFDLILCDVPCSGTGTLARNPEIRHWLRPEDFERQVERQTTILTGTLERLAKGGRLVYSTCSLEREECELVVDPVIKKIGLKRVPMDALVEELSAQEVLLPGVDIQDAISEGALRTLPGVHGCDGFFAVVLERA